MKSTPLISLAGIVLLAGTLLFVRCKTAQQPGKDEINQFLNAFNNRVKEGNTTALISYFEIGKKTNTLKRFVNLLAGGKDVSGKGKSVADISFDVDASEIKIMGTDWVKVNIPAKFSHDALDAKSSILTLKIHRVAPHKYKIIQADARQFLTDYMAYESFVRSKVIDEKARFSPITLAAFKTAAQLKARYDSVIWFAHVDTRTFFYVVKGKWNMNVDINRYKDSTVAPYKMGLVSPDLKEIIPAEYDLIHNISATFPDLVEVEKDGKRGFYDLNGKVVLPVIYDQVFPIDDGANLAVLRNGPNYFYLKKDMSVSEKVDLKVNDFFPKIKNIGSHFDLFANALAVVTEYNSRDENGAIYIPPSYLTDLNMIEKQKDFTNPLRKARNENEEEDGSHKSYEVSFSGKNKESGNWFEASFYLIRDYFLGGRSEFYDKKNIIIVDKKHDKVFTQDIETDYSPEGSSSLEGICDVNSIRAINDSLLEVKSGASLYFQLYDSTKTILGGPYYNYLLIKDNKLVKLPGRGRNFGFTRYVKMDDTYLNACYKMMIMKGSYDDREEKTIDHVSPEMLRYMKNEIYASYSYQFHDKRWQNVFADMPGYEGDGNVKPGNITVDDSLTEIDKYNINWIDQKLKAVKTGANNLAAK